MEHTGFPATIGQKTGRMLPRLVSPAAGFYSQETHLSVLKKGMKKTNCVRAPPNAGDEHVGQPILAQKKLANMVDGVKIVRRELGKTP